ncbi:MAG: ImuA family protein [Pikeienuella sp.]
MNKKLSRNPRPQLPLVPGGPSLALGRAHEATGHAAMVFAAMTAGRLSGPVLWVRPDSSSDILPPAGFAPFFDPSRLVIVKTSRTNDLLWIAEEALRSGAAPVTIIEPDAPLTLTPLRRLQLAAEAGGNQAGGIPPLCLALPPQAGNAGAVESRWVCTPLISERGQARWRFECIYAKSTPPIVWETGAIPRRDLAYAA